VIALANLSIWMESKTHNLQPLLVNQFENILPNNNTTEMIFLKSTILDNTLYAKGLWVT